MLGFAVLSSTYGSDTATDECWNVIKAAKNATIQAIRKSAMSESESADKLREDLLSDTMDKASPSRTALAYVKKEIGELW